MGDLKLDIRAGLAITKLTNTVAQSTSQTLDLGLIGTALTAESCGGAGLISAEQLPQPIDIDNRDGPGRLVQDEAGQSAGAPIAVGRKEVQSSADPAGSRAVTTAAHLDVPGLITVGGGEATAVTEVLPGKGRQATASVSASISVGPLKLTGLEWNAYHRSGADPDARGSFSVGRLSLDLDSGTGLDGLLPDIPLDGIEDLLDNPVLRPILEQLGLTIEMPRVVRLLEPTDMIRVTPLKITLRDSPLGNALIAPFKVAAQPVQDQVFNAVTEAVCQAGAVMLVGDVALSVLAGTGTLSLEIGGAEASSSRFDVENPFGEIPPFTPAPTTPPPPADTPASPSPIAAPPTPTVGATRPPASEEAAPATVPSASQGPLESFCASIHPNGNSCSEGAAVALGLLGVLLTVALAGYEIRKQRAGTDGS